MYHCIAQWFLNHWTTEEVSCSTVDLKEVIKRKEIGKNAIHASFLKRRPGTEEWRKGQAGM